MEDIVFDAGSTQGDWLAGRKPIQACPTCLNQFGFGKSDRQDLSTVVDFANLFERSELDLWRDETGQHSKSDYADLHCFIELGACLEKSTGLYSFDLEQISLLRQAIVLARLGGVICSQDGDRLETLYWAFVEHLAASPHSLSNGSLKALNCNRLLMADRVQTVSALSSKLRGKTIAEIDVLLGDRVRSQFEHAQQNVPSHHWSRPDSKQIFRREISRSIDRINSCTDEWLQQLQSATTTADIFHVSDAIHDEAFLLDEILGLDCFKNDSGVTTDLEKKLSQAVIQVKDYVDWDRCPNLKCVFDRARLESDGE